MTKGLKQNTGYSKRNKVKSVKYYSPGVTKNNGITTKVLEAFVAYSKKTGTYIVRPSELDEPDAPRPSHILIMDKS